MRLRKGAQKKGGVVLGMGLGWCHVEYGGETLVRPLVSRRTVESSEISRRQSEYTNVEFKILLSLTFLCCDCEFYMRCLLHFVNNPFTFT